MLLEMAHDCEACVCIPWPFRKYLPDENLPCLVVAHDSGSTWSDKLDGHPVARLVESASRH